MTSEQDVTPNSHDGKLLTFAGDSENQNTARDINTKITSLEGDLSQLNSALSRINSSIEEGLLHLQDNDTDLTAKVSETYKRLGEMDNAYQSLIDISIKLDADILKISQNVDEVAEQSLSGLRNLEESSVATGRELAEKNQQIVSRVNALVENSRTTTDHLHESLHNNTEKLLSVENKLLTEIETLAATTKNQAETTEKELEANKARVIKLQQVDEAIIRRATTLEITSGELTQKISHISGSIQQLENKTDNLHEQLTEWIKQIRKLQDQSHHHNGLIEGLQNNFIDMSHSLLAITHIERKHFRIISAVFLLVIGAVIGLYYYQNAALSTKAQQSARQSEKLQQQINQLHTQHTTSVKALSGLDSQVGVLQGKASELDSKIENNASKLNQQLALKVKQLKHKIAGMNDTVQSINGRLNNSLLLDSIGNDNTIHGAQWLAAQPANNYIVHIATVTDKNALYDIAQRYNYYLHGRLSYYGEINGRQKIYTLLSGNYANQQQAIQMLQQLPPYIDMQRPYLMQIKNILPR